MVPGSLHQGGVEQAPCSSGSFHLHLRVGFKDRLNQEDLQEVHSKLGHHVANERGEVLISILTESEGEEALQPMATGLMRRYQQAAVEPPILLYTDKDCCSQSGPSKYQVNIDSCLHGCMQNKKMGVVMPDCDYGESVLAIAKFIANA